MNLTQSTDLTVFIAREGRELVTDSRAVAIAFGKRHKNILRTIDAMRASGRAVIADHYRLNFEPVEFADQKGERRPMYRMTAKGLSELAMSFNGEEAREIRIRFLNAFDDVANRLAQVERTITEQMHALERREGPSEFKGRLGSQLMNERKREKPELVAERAALQSLAQPSLLN